MRLRAGAATTVAVLTVIVAASWYARSRVALLEQTLVTDLRSLGFDVIGEPSLRISLLGRLSVKNLEVATVGPMGAFRASLDELRLSASGFGMSAVSLQFDQLSIDGARLVLTLSDAAAQQQPVSAPVGIPAPPAPSADSGGDDPRPPAEDERSTPAPVALSSLVLRDTVLRIVSPGRGEVVASELRANVRDLEWDRSRTPALGTVSGVGDFGVQRVLVNGQVWATAIDGTLRMGSGNPITVEFVHAGHLSEQFTGTVRVTAVNADVPWEVDVSGSSLDVGAMLGAQPEEETDEADTFSLLRGPSVFETTGPPDGRFGRGVLHFNGSGQRGDLDTLEGEGRVVVAAGTLASTPLFEALERRVGRMPLVGNSYEAFEVPFAITEGTLTLDPFLVDVGGGSLCVEGELDFPNGDLRAVQLRLRFPRDTFDASGAVGVALNALTTDDGVTVIPLSAEGSLRNPTVEFGLDRSDMVALVEARGEAREAFPQCGE